MDENLVKLTEEELEEVSGGGKKRTVGTIAAFSYLASRFLIHWMN